jgi:hypothetical protein
VGFGPKCARYYQSVDAGVFPPSSLVTGAVDLAMMSAALRTARHRGEGPVFAKPASSGVSPSFVTFAIDGFTIISIASACLGAGRRLRINPQCCHALRVSAIYETKPLLFHKASGGAADFRDA